jgi:putative flippase GtrA
LSERARLLRFLLTGGASAAVAAVARWLLDLVLSYEAAVALSYLFGMTVAFVLARLFVFGSPDSARADWSGARGEYARFALVNAVAFAQVWLVSVGLARLLFPAVGFEWHADTVAHLIGLASPVWTSYLGHKHFSFRVGSAGGAAGQGTPRMGRGTTTERS